MAQRTIRRLILVFDADAGAVSAFVDSARKLLHVGGCSLCATTHGLFGEKSEWTQCKDALGVRVDSLHRDELFGRVKDVVGEQLPCVVAETDDGEMVMLLDPAVLERSRGSVSDFQARLLHHAAMRDLVLAEP
ncbi:MAG: hypothetical protein AAGC60_12645 [Acidobacteriota bacterium]